MKFLALLIILSVGIGAISGVLPAFADAGVIVLVDNEFPIYDEIINISCETIGNTDNYVTKLRYMSKSINPPFTPNNYYETYVNPVPLDVKSNYVYDITCELVLIANENDIIESDNDLIISGEIARPITTVSDESPEHGEEITISCDARGDATGYEVWLYYAIFNVNSGRHMDVSDSEQLYTGEVLLSIEIFNDYEIYCYLVDGEDSSEIDGNIINLIAPYIDVTTAISKESPKHGETITIICTTPGDTTGYEVWVDYRLRNSIETLNTNVMYNNSVTLTIDETYEYFIQCYLVLADDDDIEI